MSDHAVVCAIHYRVSTDGVNWRDFPAKNADVLFYAEAYQFFTFVRCDKCTEMNWILARFGIGK